MFGSARSLVRPRPRAVRLIVVAILTVCWSGPLLLGAEVATVFFDDKLQEIDATISLAISDGHCPGGVLWLERNGAAYHKAFGSRAIEPARESMSEDTLFDAASLTKVVATTPSIMKLIEEGKLDLAAPVSRFIPEFTGGGKETVTLRHLLTHTSGLRPGLPLAEPWTGVARAIELACAETLTTPPGTAFRYSDINFILLGEIVHRVSGQTLDVFSRDEVFRPLKMNDTQFLPPATLRPRIAPTERLQTPTNGSSKTSASTAAEVSMPEVLRGVVHDPTSRRMGGVAGHAGLFTTAADLARYSRMMLARGELEGIRLFKPETVALMTSVQTAESVPARRGLGWDIDSAYAGPRGEWLPIGSYGHTGWTGGSLWIDPFSQTFIIFLSNRNHPTEAGNVLPLRRTIGTLTAEAVRGFNFLHVPGALPAKPASAVSSRTVSRESIRRNVLCGIDVLARDKFKALRGLKIGLVTNQTGVDRRRRATIDLLQKADGVQLVSLFSPEHGIRGVLDEKVGDSRDEQTGLPIYSLYAGEKRAPGAEQLAEIDALVFDIQDVGCRFYTYISTLGECIVAAANAGKKIVVLDRPNPITGVRVEGPMLAAPRSFTAWHELPLRHGMTVGELAKLFAAERAPTANLEVIACDGWKREMWFDETAVPWTNPSPNMRSLQAALLYPGVGLLEFCNVSVGRGTDRPFEIFGAPYIDDAKLATAIAAANLPGLRVIPVRFTPNASVFKGQECKGVQFIVTDRQSFAPVDLGIVLATTLHAFYPRELKIEKLSRLLAEPATLDAIRAGKSLPEIKALWAPARERFATLRDRCLLYR
jgi:uncharacterized protein YbbC (DUF1343 family)/CubicO group peptidase (beta-lactamase class C family)